MNLLDFPVMQGHVLFFIGMALGFSLAAPPGPANAIIAYFSTHRSRFSGFLAGMGASSADAIILLLLYFTGFASIINDIAGRNLFIVGGTVMFILAVVIAKNFNKIQNNNLSMRSTSPISYIAGLVTNISSPYTITWWLAVGFALLTTLGLAVVGFFASLMVWNISFPTILAYSKKKLPQIQKYVTVFSVVTLSAFGILFILKYFVQ